MCTGPVIFSWVREGKDNALRFWVDSSGLNSRVLKVQRRRSRVVVIVRSKSHSFPYKRDLHFTITISLQVVMVFGAGRAVSYLKQQIQKIADSPYAQLNPQVMAASKGTLERLSKLPGWKRPSMRKK